jgi:hypothetical protein
MIGKSVGEHSSTLFPNIFKKWGNIMNARRQSNLLIILAVLLTLVILAATLPGKPALASECQASYLVKTGDTLGKADCHFWLTGQVFRLVQGHRLSEE